MQIYHDGIKNDKKTLTSDSNELWPILWTHSMQIYHDGIKNDKKTLTSDSNELWPMAVSKFPNLELCRLISHFTEM